MIAITKEIYEKADNTYMFYVQNLQDLELQLRKLPREKWARDYRKELEHMIERYRLTVKALDEYKRELGLVNCFGHSLV